MAVSSVNDKGNLVLFDEKGSFIIPGINKDLISRLRALVKQAHDKVDLHRENGIFHMKAWKLKPGFTRQGRCKIILHRPALNSPMHAPMPAFP